MCSSPDKYDNMSEQTYHNVGDFVFCFNKKPRKGTGIFTFMIKEGNQASFQESAGATSPAPLNVEGQIILDQHGNREIERELINRFGSDTPVKIKGKFKDKLVDDVEGWTLLVQITHIGSQKHESNNVILVEFLSAFAARQNVGSVDLSSC